MNSAHLLAYIGLSSTYTNENYFEPFNKDFMLLTDKEVERMRAIDMNVGGSAYREAIVWALNVVHEEYVKGSIDTFDKQMLFNQICTLRGKVATLYDYADQPVPLSYIHMVTVLSIVYLPALAYVAGLNVHHDDPLDVQLYYAITFLISVFFFLGLRCLGEVLSDPYGHHVEDLSILHYVNFTNRMSRRIVLAECPKPCSLQEETAINAARTDLGSPFAESIVDAARAAQAVGTNEKSRSGTASAPAFKAATKVEKVQLPHAMPNMLIADMLDVQDPRHRDQAKDVHVEAL